MTKDEFEQGYALRSGISIERLRKLGRYAAPCDCSDESCKGWQMLHTLKTTQESRALCTFVPGISADDLRAAIERLPTHAGFPIIPMLEPIETQVIILGLHDAAPLPEGDL